MKRFFLSLFIASAILTGFQSNGVHPLSQNTSQDPDDSLIWQAAANFTTQFNKGDTAAINRLLPGDFMFEWLHENFLGKKSLLKAMIDTAVHATLQHRVNRDANAVISYSDDHKAASLDVTFEFLDPSLVQAVKKQNSYGVCIMYFQKQNAKWCLKMVHLDIHCATCSI